MAQAGEVAATLLALIMRMEGLLGVRKMVRLAVAARGLLMKVKQVLQEALILLEAGAAATASTWRLVLVVLAVLPLVVVAVEHLLTATTQALVALVVLALFASTLGKELTWQTDMQLWKTGLLPT